MKLFQRMYKKGFTLVELIIVITILSILAIIVFVSFQNYIKDARDGNRITTLANFQKGLDLYATKIGKYPLPNGNILTGSLHSIPLALVGNIGNQISNVINMSQTPTDPVSQNNYIYGVSENQQYYQIATILENLQTSSMISTTYANVNQAYVVGNYKGLYKRGENVLYNLPSLIFTGSGNLISTETFFVINKGQNLPYKLNHFSLDNNQTTTQVLEQLTGKKELILTGEIVTLWNYKSLTGVLGYDEDIIGIARFGEKEYREKIRISTGDTDEIVTPVTCNDGENGSSGVCKDPYWSNVALMMHFDGEDGGTNFIDEKGHTGSIYGNVKISSTTSKFGGKSIYFDGDGDYLTIPYDQLLSIDATTDKFTVEFYVNMAEIKDQCILDNGSQHFQNQTNYTVWLSGGKLATYIGQATTASTYMGFSSSQNSSIHTWYHYAFVKDGDTIKTFINGNLEKTDTLSFIPTMLSYRYLTIGNQSTTTPVQYHYKGYIDELRITNGVARYSDSFTPPTNPFPNQ